MDYVVISDLHLGFDVYVIQHEAAQQRIARINKNLAAFIHGHTDRCLRLGRSCTLVILGDFIEFCKASFAYSEEDKAELDWNERAYVDGLLGTERNMAWKARRIAEAHWPIFESLGRFIIEGNRIVIVSGNHDSMLYWKGVQKAIRESICAAAPQSRAPGTAIENRIEFHHWFYLQPGLFYMEHGHRFDTLTTSEYPLLPMDLYDPKRVFLPINILASQYYGPNYYGLTPSEALTASVGELMQSARESQKADQRPFRDHLALLNMYFRVNLTIFIRWAKSFFFSSDWRWQENEAELRQVARQSDLPMATIRTLYSLNVRPLEIRPAKMAQLFCFDLLIILIGFLMVFPWALKQALGHPETVSAVIMSLLLLPLTIALIMFRFRGRAALLSPPDDMQERIASIATLLNVPAIVLGHTHLMTSAVRDNALAVLSRASQESTAVKNGEVEGQRTHLALNSGTWELEQKYASFLHFDQASGGYRVRTGLWDFDTQETINIDDLPLRRTMAEPRYTSNGRHYETALGTRLFGSLQGTTWRLKGIIDRSVWLDRLFVGAAGDHLTLDLTNVVGVTTAGIAHWITTMNRRRQRRIALLGCPPRLVEAFRSMQDALHPLIHIISWYEPLVCSACGKEHNKLLVADFRMSPATTTCDCGAILKPLIVRPGGLSEFLRIARARVEFPSGIPATLWIEPSITAVSCNLEQVSRQGCRIRIVPDELDPAEVAAVNQNRRAGEVIRTIMAVPVSHCLRLEFGLPSLEGTMRVTGEIRWKRLEHDGSVHMGCQFKELGAGSAQILSSCVDTLLHSAPRAEV